MNVSRKRQVIDAHVHLYDSAVNRYDFLESVDPMFHALVGDYATLPRTYMPEAYLSDMSNLEVKGIVWHEFLSTDPVREVLWAQRVAEQCKTPMAIVGRVDFLAPDLEETLAAFARCVNVTGVREHLGWDEHNPRRRFARRPDLLSDPRWRRGLEVLERHRFKCSLEVFSPQLPDLITVVRSLPNIGFTIAVMGWPSGTDESTFKAWRCSLEELSQSENVCIIISAIECIFGMTWTLLETERWTHTVFESFGTKRVMFGGHHPICGLSSTFPAPYQAYEAVSAFLSRSEQDAVFHVNAAKWFFGDRVL